MLSGTALGESYIMKIDRYLDTKENHFFDVEGVYNM